MGVKYDVDKQKEAVKVLALNGRNYHLTSKQIGVSCSSLKRWEAKYPEMLQSGDKVLTTKILKEGDDAQAGFIEKVMAGKQLAIDRILTLIPQEKNLSTLVSVMDTLNAITEDKDDVKGRVNSIFLQINEQIGEL